jgi:hypothetical protein
MPRRCQFEGCGIFPQFNFKGGKNGILCYNHREINMINIVTTVKPKLFCNLDFYGLYAS